MTMTLKIVVDGGGISGEVDFFVISGIIAGEEPVHMHQPISFCYGPCHNSSPLSILHSTLKSLQYSSVRSRHSQEPSKSSMGVLPRTSIRTHKGLSRRRRRIPGLGGGRCVGRGSLLKGSSQWVQKMSFYHSVKQIGVGRQERTLSFFTSCTSYFLHSKFHNY